jgi:hypothetical protein
MKRKGKVPTQTPRATCFTEILRRENKPGLFGKFEYVYKNYARRLLKQKIESRGRYTTYELDHYHALTFGNERFFNEAKDAGCFSCLNHIKLDEVKWFEESRNGNRTAQCPVCQIDSVIFETRLERVDDELLKELRNEYFASSKD